MENKPAEEKKTNYTFWRILVVGIILILLVFLSIGIVRIVPKALNSLANASLSIGSLLDTNSGPTETNPTTTKDTGDSNTTDSTTDIASNTNSDGKGGFSIRDLTNQSNTGSKNYVPGNDSLPSQNTTISGNTSGVGGSDSAGSKSSNARPSGNTQITNEASVQYSNTARTVGASDIAVEIVSKGIISNGVFVPTNTFTTSDVVVIKFKIENRGQYATGNWSARVDMPSYNNSDKVRSLTNIGSIPAGAAITGEARFDSPISGNTSATITVDTTSTTQDTNRGNNTATATFAVSGTNAGNSNGGGSNWTAGTGADLQVRILSTGTVNQFGQYVANTNPRLGSGEKAAIRFEVTNIGGTYTSTWNWRADASGAITNTYYAPAENGLAPGASTRLIVGFDAVNFNYGYNYGYGYNQQAQFTVMVDSGNVVYESNEGNNTASVSMTVGY